MPHICRMYLIMHLVIMYATYNLNIFHMQHICKIHIIYTTHLFIACKLHTIIFMWHDTKGYIYMNWSRYAYVLHWHQEVDI